MKSRSRIRSIIESEIKILLESDKTNSLLKKFPNKITQDIVNKMLEIDPSINPEKPSISRYADWLCTMYIQEPFDPMSMKSYVTEFYQLNKSKRIKVDINTCKTKEELIKLLNKYNKEKTPTNREDESNFKEMSSKNGKFRIFVPFSQAASNWLGNHYFMPEGYTRCEWCITYSLDDYWKDYYVNHDLALVMILVVDQEVKSKLEAEIPGFNFYGVCLGIYNDRTIANPADIDDIELSTNQVKKFFEITKISLNLVMQD